MKTIMLDSVYRIVLPAQKEQLLDYSSTHPVKHLNVNGYDWQYQSRVSSPVPAG